MLLSVLSHCDETAARATDGAFRQRSEGRLSHMIMRSASTSPEHGVRTILVLDPEGNIVQLFEPIK